MSKLGIVVYLILLALQNHTTTKSCLKRQPKANLNVTADRKYLSTRKEIV